MDEAMNYPEDHIQIQVARVLDLSGLRWCHVPNEGQRNIVTGARLKKKGLKRGVPDVLIFNPNPHGVGLAIELKAGKKKPTPEQSEWIAELYKLGWSTAICNTVDAAIDMIALHYPEKIKR